MARCQYLCYNRARYLLISFLFFTCQAFPPGTRFQLRLEHASDDLRLHSTEEDNTHKLIITDITLSVTRVQVDRNIKFPIQMYSGSTSHTTADLCTVCARKINLLLQQESSVSRSISYTGDYLLPKCSNTFFLQLGSTTFDCTLSRGPRPIQMYVFICPTVSIQGLRTRNPYRLVHAGLTNALVTFESELNS